MLSTALQAGLSVSLGNMLQCVYLFGPDVAELSWQPGEPPDPFILPLSAAKGPADALDATLLLRFTSGYSGASGSKVAKRRRALAAGVKRHANSAPGQPVPEVEMPPPPTDQEASGCLGIGLTGQPVSRGPVGEDADVPFDPSETLESIMSLPFYRGQVCHKRVIGAVDAEFAELEQPLPQPLAATLEALGLSRLFSHQAAAIDAGRRGENIVLSTSTSSGKSLVYNTLVANSFIERCGGTALYIFPTKALAQDQLRGLQQLVSCGWLGDLVVPMCYDGDTPEVERKKALASATVILTNPDTLHVAALPNHWEWQRLLKNLRVVVLDEAHVYRGLFGSHVANIMRRLIRLCWSYGNDAVQFICCSATLQHPTLHFHHLVPNLAGNGSGPVSSMTSTAESSSGVNDAIAASHRNQVPPTPKWPLVRGPLVRGLAEISVDGSGRGARTFCIWNPFSPNAGLEDPAFAELSAEHRFSTGQSSGNDEYSGSSAIVETALLLSALVKRQVRTLVFCKVRALTELVMSHTIRDLKATAPYLIRKVGLLGIWYSYRRVESSAL